MSISRNFLILIGFVELVLSSHHIRYPCDFFDVVKGPVWKLPDKCTDFHGLLSSRTNYDYLQGVDIR